MKKIIILVISLDQYPYTILENTCRNTWVINNKNVNVLFLHSKPDISPYIDNSNLYVNGVEGLYNIGYKTINAFDFLLKNNEFDYIYRTNLSSYVHIDGLINHINSIETTNIYSGVIGTYGGILFASGSGYLISKDLVQYVVNNRHEWNHDTLIDDVSIAHVLRSNGVYPSPLPRIDILTEDDFNAFDFSKINNCFHFRCKSETDRMHDVKVMNMLYKHYSKEL